jgi:hypothetical protein
MVTVTVAFLTVCALLLGNTTSKALLVTKVEVNIKKIKSKNTKSVMEDMLNSGETLLRVVNFMDSGF